jgi:hypothetical protein
MQSTSLAKMEQENLQQMYGCKKKIDIIQKLVFISLFS